MVVLFVFSSITAASGGTKKRASTTHVAEKGKPATQADKSNAKILTGKVISVNSFAQTITLSETIKGKEEKTVVILDDKTGVTMGNEKKMLGDIGKGDKVSVQYREVDGKKIAKNIDVIPTKAPKKK